MSVIAFPNLSPQGPEASMSWELRSLTAINRSPLNAVATTLERPGAHWAVRMPYRNLAESRRARLQTLAASARGHAQRFYVPVYGWTRRGSFPATELLTNNAFASTSGWTAGSDASLSVSDGIMRVTRVAVTGATAYGSQSVSGAVQYAPYAARVQVVGRRGAAVAGVSLTLGDSSTTTNATPGLRTVSLVAIATSGTLYLENTTASGVIAGDYFDVGYASLARCALVDNGPNLWTHSSSLANAAWTKTGGAATDGVVAGPDGTLTTSDFTEDTSTGQHEVTRSIAKAASALDYFIVVDVRPSGRDVGLQLNDSGANNAFVYFTLSGAGAIASGPTVSGTFSNARAGIQSLGNGWYRIWLGARTSTDTALVGRIFGHIAASASYTGNASNGFNAQNATLVQAGVPSKPVLTTASATTGTAQTGGALYLKGLPASTSGLLLQGDPAEIITGSTSQLVRTRSPLNSDAAGLGYFEFEPPLRISPSDNAAVIIHNPLCRMMMENNVNGWTDRIGGFADLEFSAVEDVSP